LFLTTIKKNYKQVFRTLYYVRNYSNIKARESVNSLCKHEIPILRRLFQVVNAAGRKQMGVSTKKKKVFTTPIYEIQTALKNYRTHESKDKRFTY